MMSITFKYFRPKKHSGATYFRQKKEKGWAAEFLYCHPIASPDGRLAVDRLTGEAVPLSQEQYIGLLKETQDTIESIRHLDRANYISELKKRIVERRNKLRQ